jgi:mono/diheme cytochrome c family protein
VPRVLKSGRGVKRIAAVGLTLIGLGLLAGCDASENADTARGRQLFTSKCGTCHQLAEAGTTANIGPNLDAAFTSARATGMDNDTIEGVVQTQIEVPRKVSLSPDDPNYSKQYMPANLVEGQDAEDVATYVASVAGVPGIGPPKVPGGPGAQVFANNGCAGCHTFAAAGSNGNVGPNLDEVLPGMSSAMINMSIVNPNAKVETGYPPNVMPQTYGDTITPDDLKDLVDYLSQNAGKKAK